MKYRFLISAIFLLFACKHQQKQMNANVNQSMTINSTDPSLSFKNGYWNYKNNLFTGTIIERYKDKSIHKSTQYVNGKEDGCQIIFYPGGSLSEKRYFKKGEKHDLHAGWWQNGNKRFEYHFTNGVYNGDYKEWYQSGQLLKHVHYNSGIDDWGKGWRESGKPYMNYVVKNGRRYGIVNSNLCYTVKKGSGEYVSSAAAN